VTGEDGLYVVDARDSVLGRATFANHGFEVAFMDQALKILDAQSGLGIRGRLMVDVGANVGVTAVPAMKRFGAAGVIAIEPDPENVRLLKANLALNSLGDAVQVHACAVSAESGQLVLERSPNNSGDHRIRMTTEEGRFGEEHWETTPVPVSTLDQIVADVDVALIWLDVQGHEGHVLAGARELLARGVPVVSEFWPYALTRAGGLMMFRQAVEHHGLQLVLLRDGPRGMAAGMTMRFDDLVAHLGERGTTDLLIIPR